VRFRPLKGLGSHILMLSTLSLRANATMNVVAVIVEQLEADGRIKRLTMGGSTPRFDIAFPDELVGERSGPFFFPNPIDEHLFKQSFADSKVLKLARDCFQEANGNYILRTERGGIPTERGGLSYYCLSLPRYAIPVEVVLKDPRSNKQLFKSVYRDELRNRFVIYVECASRYGMFDFVLEVQFRIEKGTFRRYSYEDERKDDFLSKYGRQVTAYEELLPFDEREIARKFFSANGERSRRTADCAADVAKTTGHNGTRFSAPVNGHALTAHEVAGLLNMHVVTVYKLASSGRLPSFKVGYSLRFRPEQIQAFIEHGGSRANKNGAR
jgi:excisionase family DNA binding protein